MLEIHDFFLVGLAAVAAGAVNALAGGGTLITFPMLTAVGVPAVSANVTNAVALFPGYFGATIAQAPQLRGQRRRLWICVPAGIVGGVLGGILLLSSGEKLFRTLVPYLILLASCLLAVQGKVRTWVMQRTGPSKSSDYHERWASLPVGAAAVYGGYFSAGMSVLILAVLGLVLEDSLTRLNALKQATASSVNIAAAVYFLFSGHVVWSAALVMAVGALIGGVLGGKLAGKIKPTTLRWTVVTLGVLVSLVYLIR